MPKIKDVIKKLLAEQTVETQKDLKMALSKKGLKVTQSTISRNLKKLGAGKIVEQGNVKYQLPPANLGFKGLESLVKQIDYNSQMIIIKTHTGSANTVGEYIDKLNLTSIMGTLAGDNTILIIPKDFRRIVALKEQLQKIFRL